MSLLVALLAIGVDIGLARLGYGLLLPAIRTDLGGSYSVYGAIGAVHLGGYLAGTIVAARFIGARHRTHLPRVIAATHGVVAITLAGSALAGDAAVLGVMRAFIGVASGIGIAAAVTDALERTAPARRGFASGVAWAGIGLGLIISAPAGQWALADAPHWRTVTFAFAAVTLVVPLLALTVKPFAPNAATAAGAERAFRWHDLITPRYLAFVAAYTCFGVAYISFATFAIAAFARRGIVGGALTGVWFAFGIAAVAGALGIGGVLSGNGRRYALALPMAAGCLGCVLSLRNEWPAAIAGAVAVGSSLAATPGVASAYARERSDARTAAQAFAAVTACFGIGQMAGPLVSGALADGFGPSAAAFVGATVFGLGTLLALLDAALMRSRA